MEGGGRYNERLEKSREDFAKGYDPKSRESEVLGIDLGTTYSVVGLWKNGNVDVYVNECGNRTTPSVVGFNDKEVLVGEAAKNQVLINAKNTIYESKRMMGKKFDDPRIQNDMKTWPFKVISGPNNKINIEVTYLKEKKIFMPEEIGGFILSHLQKVAARNSRKNISRAVVTVPAYFNDAQRLATKDAGRLANMDIMRIVNEPTAACMAYGLHRKAGKGCKERHVLIFDLGGGTYDVSILSVEDGVFEVKGTNGNTHLGGEDFDRRLTEHFMKDLMKEHPGHPEIADDFRIRRRLQTALERAKRSLSSRVGTQIEIDCLFKGNDFRITLTRKRFESLCSDLFDKLLEPLHECIRDCKLKKNNVDDVVLVGGSTRIPFIQEMIQKEFPERHMARSINPDEAVGYGAAIQGAVLSNIKGALIGDLLLLDVIPISIGVETNGKFNEIMLPKNSAIPMVRSDLFAASNDFQPEITVKVVEGERPNTADCNLLGEFKVLVKPVTAAQSKIKISFDIDIDGVLNVTAEDTVFGVKGRTLTIQSTSRTLSQNEVDRLIGEAKQHADKDKEFTKCVKAKVNLRATVSAVQKFMNEKRNLIKIKPEERAAEFKRWLYYYELWADHIGYDDAALIKSKEKIVKAKWQEIINKPIDNSFVVGYYENDYHP